ncbi:unnamed protein product, partial [Closterium sp. NIES-54]
ELLQQCGVPYMVAPTVHGWRSTVWWTRSSQTPVTRCSSVRPPFGLAQPLPHVSLPSVSLPAPRSPTPLPPTPGAAAAVRGAVHNSTSGGGGA